METFLPLLLIMAPIFVANIVAASQNKTNTTIFEIFVALFNIPLLLVGILLLFIPVEVVAFLEERELPVINFVAAGWVLILMAVSAIGVCIPAVRRIFGRIITIDPQSPVHTLSLVLAGYLIGNTLFALSQDFLSELVETELTVTMIDIILQQLAFVVAAFVGVGLLTRRNLNQIYERLGLVRPTLEQLLYGLVVIVVLIGIQWAIGIIWVLLDPEQAAALTEVNEILLGNVDTVGEWFILAFASGVGEEILFRGALQPIFGIVGTSLLFAIVHVQYGLTPITAAVFIIGLVLGILRRRTNTTTAIFVHFSYNFILGLLALLASYVQQYVG
ncbi:MAG: CPBP family intramembrane glutamic endopeptidase [Candidatus Promineifilaceae bacterium]|nr:CPBP family intramembrane glutamic endopeptidase [Candidatus Promineifilaceae bacterium]